MDAKPTIMKWTAYRLAELVVTVVGLIALRPCENAVAPVNFFDVILLFGNIQCYLMLGVILIRFFLFLRNCFSTCPTDL